MTKQDKIDLLMKYIKGEIPVSKLKLHKVIFFMYMSKNQKKIIEAITGPVVYHKSQYMPDGDTICGLFDGIPVGFTGVWHLSMLWYPECLGSFIDGRNSKMFNEFIEELKLKHHEQN